MDTPRKPNYFRAFGIIGAVIFVVLFIMYEMVAPSAPEPTQPLADRNIERAKSHWPDIKKTVSERSPIPLNLSVMDVTYVINPNDSAVVLVAGKGKGKSDAFIYQCELRIREGQSDTMEYFEMHKI